MKGANVPNDTNDWCNYYYVYPVDPKLPIKVHPYAFKPVEKQIFANATMVVSSERTKCSIPVQQRSSIRTWHHDI